MRHIPRYAVALAATVASLSIAAPAGAANRWLTPQPLTIAHQGGEDEFPSNTLYAFKQSVKAGADMLELDIVVTKDHQVIVLHDTTLDGKTNGTGTVVSKTLKQIEKLDGAYWFSSTGKHYDHGKKASAYAFRGIATGKRKPPKGFKASDFRVALLKDVLKAFPDTPINIEIKGRTKQEADAEYIANAEVLAKLLKPIKRTDLIVTSFHQKAVVRYHELDPQRSLAPGVEGAEAFLLAGTSPGEGVQTFDLPVTYELNGQIIQVAAKDFIDKAHAAGFAWHTWFDDRDPDTPAEWGKLIDLCVDGVMTPKPVAFAKFAKTHPRPASCG